MISSTRFKLKHELYIYKNEHQLRVSFAIELYKIFIVDWIFPACLINLWIVLEQILSLK